MTGNWHRHGGVAWTPGVIAHRQLRGWIDTFIPWEQVRVRLCALGRAFLPDDDWIPRMLSPGMLDSIVDFWAQLPAFAGRLEFREDELPALYCAMASPPQYGTSDGRYSGQLRQLQELPRPPRSLLDLGCGVGLGTLEIASALHIGEVLGVTVEPLEAWMAQHRILPHDPPLEKHFRRFGSHGARFVSGDVLDFHPGRKYGLVVCNGLAGGRFMHCADALVRLVDKWSECAADDGVVAVANAFHSGRRRSVEALMDIAAGRGWRIDGDWNGFIARRRTASDC